MAEGSEGSISTWCHVVPLLQLAACGVRLPSPERPVLLFQPLEAVQALNVLHQGSVKI